MLSGVSILNFSVFSNLFSELRSRIGLHLLFGFWNLASVCSKFIHSFNFQEANVHALNKKDGMTGRKLVTLPNECIT